MTRLSDEDLARFAASGICGFSAAQTMARELIAARVCVEQLRECVVPYESDRAAWAALAAYDEVCK